VFFILYYCHIPYSLAAIQRSNIVTVPKNKIGKNPPNGVNNYLVSFKSAKGGVIMILLVEGYILKSDH